MTGSDRGEASDAGTRVAVVTGGNRGIGREIARQLAARGLTTILTARDLGKAELAAAPFERDGLPVVARRLDVTDQRSVDDLAASLEVEPGRIDVLVNNAGVLLDESVAGTEPDLGLIRATFETNLLGAWRVTAALLPLMRRGGYGRIVNLSSGSGQLSDMWGGSPGYRVSKTSLNAMTRILAHELAGTGVLVNCCCPGWVETDMGGPNAQRSVEEGADTPVWLAILPDDGPTGRFFRDRRPIPW
jgi:NAD(P)-dependent dehydrogenase (short-subunit alcohol dehydrogenase family)